MFSDAADSDVGEHNVSADGNEFRSVPGNLSPAEQPPGRVAVASLANDRRRLDHGSRLRHAAARHLQTGARQNNSSNDNSNSPVQFGRFVYVVSVGLLQALGNHFSTGGQGQKSSFII